MCEMTDLGGTYLTLILTIICYFQSSFSDFDGKCLYFITLSISDDSKSLEVREHRTVKFACTVQQLQSLVASLRAAVRQLDSIASLSK